jgi:integrase
MTITSTTPAVSTGDRLPKNLDPTITAALAALAEEAHSYTQDLHAQNTKRAYLADWRDFSAWCATHTLSPLPATPTTLTLYLTAATARRKTSTLERRLCAIAAEHKAAGYPTPTADPDVRALLAGIRRAKGTRQTRKRPTVTHEVCAMVDALPDTLLGRRDRALLLLGFAGGFRRSELVALDVADVEETAGGLVVTIRRSKTDQEGAGRRVGIPYGGRHCPARALHAWLAAAGIAAGPLFRRFDRQGRLLPLRLSDKGVARLVQRQAAALGLDPTQYGGHSLRAGLATAAAAAGKSERAIMAQTGHKSAEMVRRYIRDGELFRDNAADLGL